MCLSLSMPLSLSLYIYFIDAHIHIYTSNSKGTVTYHILSRDSISKLSLSSELKVKDDKKVNRICNDLIINLVYISFKIFLQIDSLY